MTGVELLVLLAAVLVGLVVPLYLILTDSLPRRPTSTWLLTREGVLVDLSYVRYCTIVDLKDDKGLTTFSRIVVGWARTPALETTTATILYQGQRPDCEKIQASLADSLGAIRL